MKHRISHYGDGRVLGIATSDEIEANILCTKTLTSLSIIRLILANKEKKHRELAALRHLFFSASNMNICYSRVCVGFRFFISHFVK